MQETKAAHYATRTDREVRLLGNFMIPVCCVCGKASVRWHDPEWEDAGGLQDFCPEHANYLRDKHGDFKEYLVPHLRPHNTTIGWYTMEYPFYIVIATQCVDCGGEHKAKVFQSLPTNAEGEAVGDGSSCEYLRLIKIEDSTNSFPEI